MRLFLRCNIPKFIYNFKGYKGIPIITWTHRLFEQMRLAFNFKFLNKKKQRVSLHLFVGSKGGDFSYGVIGLSQDMMCFKRTLTCKWHVYINNSTQTFRGTHVWRVQKQRGDDLRIEVDWKNQDPVSLSFENEGRTNLAIKSRYKIGARVHVEGTWIQNSSR